MKCVTFLLGAGASIPAGYSSTKKLTQKILDPKRYCRDSDERYRPLVCRLIDWLNYQVLSSSWKYKNITYEYYTTHKDYIPYEDDFNYEDLYYLASQLRDNSPTFQNPAILPFISELKREMSSWPKYTKLLDQSYGRDELEFSGLCGKTCDYIKDIVVNVLSHESKSTKHLELITAIHETNDLKLQGIATLAHDTHVENYLLKQGISLVDGFSSKQTDCGYRIWKDHFHKDGIPFIKLHGSISWKILHKFLNNNRLLATIGINMVNSECSQKSLPLLVLGTFNKPALYSMAVLRDIHYRFSKILEKTNTLVVCGYSFGDEGINMQLSSWWNNSNGSFVVIDPRKCRDVRKHTDGDIDYILHPKNTEFITKKMEEVSTDELINLL